MDDARRHAVFDFGTYETFAGIAGDDAPLTVFPSVVGRPKQKPGMVGMGNPEFQVGDAAISLRGVMKLQPVMEDGIITNFDHFERLVHHTFYNELRLDPENHGVVFGVPLFSPLMQEQKMSQILFETFNVPEMGGFTQPALSMYSSGRASGISVDIGHGMTQMASIYEGTFIAEGAYRGSIAGAALNTYAERLMTEQISKRGASIAGIHHQIDDLKRKNCYVAASYDSEMLAFSMSNQNYQTYTFTEGRSVEIGAERIRIPEVLFKPSLIGSEELPLSHLIYRSIMKSPMDIRKDLFGNIILGGGSSLIPGLEDRLRDEIAKLAPSSMRVRIVAPPERKYANWIGGSIVGSLSTTQHTLFTKEQYEESGPSAFHRYGSIPRDKSQETIIQW